MHKTKCQRICLLEFPVCKVQGKWSIQLLATVWKLNDFCSFRKTAAPVNKAMKTKVHWKHNLENIVNSDD